MAAIQDEEVIRVAQEWVSTLAPPGSDHSGPLLDDRGFESLLSLVDQHRARFEQAPKEELHDTIDLEMPEK